MIREKRNAGRARKRRLHARREERKTLARGQDGASVAGGGPGRMHVSWNGAVRMKTILLIDHDAEHRRQQGDSLSRAGYRVVSARNAASGLFIIKSGMILDLIVTEYAMPDMDSREFLAAVRKESPSVPVIVVTGCDSADSYLHAVNMGVYEYLSKPLLPGELQSTIRNAVHARRSGSLPAGVA